MSSYWEEHYRPSRPRQAKGGIHLVNRGGEIAGTWWGKQWIAALESFGWHTRLERGRRYARSGQVMDIRLEPGRVESKVQGSRAKPYDVTIHLHPFSKKDWLRIAGTLSKNALWSAQLLAGEMPEGIESAFKGAGTSLFPKTKQDLATDCSCPDWENPCKHIAAAHYVLAQELDRDPFLLFKVRGMERAGFLSLVRACRRADYSPPDPDGPGPGVTIPSPSEAKPPETAAASFDLNAHKNGFFHLRAPLEESVFALPSDFPRQLPKVGGKIREMGPPLFWRGEADFSQTLIRYHQHIRQHALKLALASRPKK